MLVTDGVESAVAQAEAFAGDGDVSVSAGTVGGQALAAGLLDEVRVDPVPVVSGAGVRYFGNYAGSPLLPEDAEVVLRDDDAPARPPAEALTHQGDRDRVGRRPHNVD